MVGRRSKLYGVGVNDSDYITQKLTNGGREICPFYARWRDMLRRCYSEKFQATAKTYIGCSVHPDWHSFMAFRAWMVEQNWYGKVLDKDLLVQGNKVYSPFTCIFVTVQVNNFLLDNACNRGRFPVGVYWQPDRRKYAAQCKSLGRGYIPLGRFDTVEDASAAYISYKAKMAIELAERQDDPRVSEALLKRYVK